MSAMTSVTITPAAGLRGSLRVAGDKSLSHRAGMLCALASGVSTIDGFLASEDCLCTLKAVEQLGATVERQGERVRIRGVGGLFRAPSGPLDMGNSGTGIRLLAGLLAGHPFVSELTGDESLRSRPMRRIAEPLMRMGARVDLLGPNGCAPLRVSGGALHGIEYPLPMASAQVKSCILLAGLFAGTTTTVIEKKPTRDHTERMLRAMGVDIRVDGLRVTCHRTGPGAPALNARDWVIPSDFSSAAFWMVAAAAWPGAEVELRDVGLNPRRTALLDVLRRMGADVECRLTGEGSAQAWEPCGTVIVRGAALHGVEVGGDEIPNLIDELPVLAVAAALAEGETVVRDAAELRVKESDRIRTTVTGLTAMGVRAEAREDGFRVEGPSRVRGGAEIDSFGDHRIAMAMTVLALRADAPVVIRNVDCVATSYPSFWNDLATLTRA